jgi:membrane-associated phospholipid phosphatase
MKIIAQIISYIFHPIFLVSYGMLILYLINPYLFSIADSKTMGVILIYIFLLSVFFPILSISLMKSLGFISSFKMVEKSDRIGPLICTAIFYLWLYINIYSNPAIPTPFSIFVLGSVISLFIAFFVNNFSKISLHSIGMGGALVGALLIKFNYSYDHFSINLASLGTYILSVDLFIIVVILAVGLVTSSRLYLKRHKPADVYGGLVVGIFSQVIAIMFLN